MKSVIARRSVARNLRLRLHHERCVRPCDRPYGNCVFLAKGDKGSKNCKREYIISFHKMLSHFSQNENALTCAICIDLVTDIDEFLTSDTTEDQIVQFVEQVAMSYHSYKWLSRKLRNTIFVFQLCKALGTILPDFEVII